MSKQRDEQSELQTQVDELTADLQRVQAEFLNFKRRTEDEKKDLLDFAKSRVTREFLSVRDTLDQEKAHRPADVDAKWAASIDAVGKQFDAVLKNLGVERFDSAGVAFDPKRHDAIMMEDGEGEHEVVTEELQPGYQLGDTVLRHAMVKVGRSNEVTAAPSDEPEVEAESGSGETK
jgi:molecular chaperone GrpE